MIKEAARRGELEIFYQPKVDMSQGTLVGVEALLRWRHPKLGLLQPEMFCLARLQNESDVIDLCHWVIEKAIQQISDWQKTGFKTPVSVNVMPSELNDTFCDWLNGLFRLYSDVDPSMLELEIVESSQICDPLTLFKVITRCRLIGVKFALDDFGTGYSSISYMRNLPADHVKIDKMFVNEIVHNIQDQELVKFIIGIVSVFEREAIAEGVENVNQGLMLMRLGCKIGQGYAIARPMAAVDLPGWVNGYKGHPEWMAA